MEWTTYIFTSETSAFIFGVTFQLTWRINPNQLISLVPAAVRVPSLLAEQRFITTANLCNCTSTHFTHVLKVIFALQNMFTKIDDMR